MRERVTLMITFLALTFGCGFPGGRAEPVVCGCAAECAVVKLPAQPTSPVIRGQLRSADGEPRAGACVLLFQGGREIGRTRTSEVGRFDFGWQRSGRFLLRVEGCPDACGAEVSVRVTSEQAAPLLIDLPPCGECG